MYDFLLIMKDVDQLGTWRTLGQDKGVETWTHEGGPNWPYAHVPQGHGKIGVWEGSVFQSEEKELVDSFIGLWRSLARNIKEDNVSVKELQRAARLQGAATGPRTVVGASSSRVVLIEQLAISGWAMNEERTAPHVYAHVSATVPESLPFLFSQYVHMFPWFHFVSTGQSVRGSVELAFDSGCEDLARQVDADCYWAC